MGAFWGAVRDIRTIIKMERIGGRQLVDVQEWDCFDDLVLEWRDYFVQQKRKGNRVTDSDLRHGGETFDSAMNLDGSTPPAKRSGGNATYRALELYKKYGRGDGPSFGAAMAEGKRLAEGKKSSYPTHSQPKGCLGR